MICWRMNELTTLWARLELEGRSPVAAPASPTFCPIRTVTDKGFPEPRRTYSSGLIKTVTDSVFDFMMKGIDILTFFN